MKRPISLLIVTSLLITTPGLDFYQALAQSGPLAFRTQNLSPERQTQRLLAFLKDQQAFTEPYDQSAWQGFLIHQALPSLPPNTQALHIQRLPPSKDNKNESFALSALTFFFKNNSPNQEPQ